MILLTTKTLNLEIKTMKTLTKLALAAVILCSAFAANAQSGYYRSTTSTYTYPSYSTYTPSYSSSYTTASYTPSYRPSCGSYSATPSYGTTYVNGYSGSTSVYGSSTQIGGTTYHNYYSSGGASVYGTTTTIGNSSYTTLYGN